MASNFLKKIHDKLIQLTQKHCCISHLFALVGTVYTIKKAVDMLRFIKQYFLTCSVDFKEKYGNGWVLISGATEGMGKSLAEEFLKKGCKVALLAREEDKLKLVHDEFLKLYPDSTIEVIPYDYNRDFSSMDIKELKEKIDKLEDISVLVNAAGSMEQEFLENLSDEQIKKMVNINVFTLTFLTRMVVEKMKKRKKSLIVGVGSGMATFRPGTRSVFIGTKCYMDGFMSCLMNECQNIDFTYLEIGPIIRERNMNRKIPCKLPPADVAAKVITQFGHYTYSRGHYRHALRWAVYGNCCCFRSRVNKKCMGGLMRRRAEAEKEKEQPTSTMQK